MHELARREFQRILIIKPSSFGDVIHALPVLNGLRQRFPRARISWLVATACAGLLERHPALDEIIRFDRGRYGRLGRDVKVSIEFLSFVQSLRARRFDLAIDLQGLFRSGFLALASGAPVRVGFASAREFAPLFYTHRVPVCHREMHAVDRNYLFGAVLGFSDVPVTFGLPVLPATRKRVRERLTSRGLAPGDAYVVMAPGARWETKLWPFERFADLAHRVEQLACRVVLVGMASEKLLAGRVAAAAAERGAGVVNLTGETTLAELIALVEGAAAVVMHDSGPMHLATALGRPMIALYGPTSPLRTGPYGRADSVARLDLPCAPCYLKRLSQCAHEHRCMRELPVERVFERLRELLAIHAGASG